MLLRHREKNLTPANTLKYPLFSNSNVDMNALCSLLNPENVLLGISPSSKKRVFELASQTLGLLKGIDRKELFEAFFARERLGPTYLGYGISLPHCRLAGIDEPCALFIRLHGELEPTRRGEEAVHSFLFLVVPENSCNEHLELLSNAATLLGDKQLRDKLKTVSTSDKFCQLLRDWTPSPEDN